MPRTAIANEVSRTCLGCKETTLIGKCPNCGNDVYSEYYRPWLRGIFNPETSPFGVFAKDGGPIFCTACNWKSGRMWACECAFENNYIVTIDREFIEHLSKGFWGKGWIDEVDVVRAVHLGVWSIILGIIVLTVILIAK